MSSPSPAIQRRARSLTCAEPSCIAEFQTAHSTKKFCSPECATAFHNREFTRGAALLKAARLWRGVPAEFTESGKTVARDLRQLAAMQQIVDAAAREDAAARRGARKAVLEAAE